MKTTLAILLALVLSLSCAAAAAQADVFGPIGLASVGVPPGGGFDQQADAAGDTAVSGNGRYVAFDGSFAGRRGIFRRDLLTGTVATVAEGDAVLPSISSDGRYVSFTTTARLDPLDDSNQGPDVYVRDMGNSNLAPCEAGEEAPPCAFTLASAVNGSALGLTYVYGSPFEETHNGALASGRSALSADGRKVVFETTAVSNLANPGRTGLSTVEAPETPSTQLGVRDLDTDTTRLVSARYDPATGRPAVNGSGQVEPTPTSGEGFGAVYPSGGARTPSFPFPYAGASLSADGTTVAWMGQQISEQAPVLSGSDLASKPEYTEPLWRRIGDGEEAPTRRVTGGTDPASPACQASGETQVANPPTLADPCQGPFETAGGASNGIGVWTGGLAQDYLPRLSANGQLVAFLATAREIASGEEFKAGGTSDDLYIANMQAGLTRVQATRRLTELAGGSTSDEARTAPIVDLGVSPDSTQVAFTTKRTLYPLGSPSYVSVPAASVTAMELFDVDLANDTLTRVSQSFEGGPTEPPSEGATATESPSFDEGGNLLAFSSNTDDLVYGDGNKAGDAFVVTRERFPSSPTVQEISPAPAAPGLAQTWQLQATALSRRDGSLLVEVSVPGAGQLHVGARSAVRVRIGRARGHRRGSRSSVATRTVASKTAAAAAAGVRPLVLKLSRAYAALAAARGGLSSTLSLSFSAAGHATLHATLAVTFARHVSRRGHRASRHRRGGSR